MSRRRGSRAFWRSSAAEGAASAGVSAAAAGRGPPDALRTRGLRPLEVLGPIVATPPLRTTYIEVATSDTPVQTGTAKAAGWGGIFVGGGNRSRVRCGPRTGRAGPRWHRRRQYGYAGGEPAVNKAFVAFSEMAATEAHVNDVIQRSGTCSPRRKRSCRVDHGGGDP